MANKLLVVVLTGPEGEARARQGILFALNTKRTQMMEEVELLLFGPGVSLLDPHQPWFQDLRELLADCAGEALPVYACMANAKHYRVSETAAELGVRLLGAQVHIPARIKDDYAVMTF